MLSILILGGPTGDQFVLLDAALNGLLWWLIAVPIDRLISRSKKRSVAKEAVSTLVCDNCGKEVSEEAQFCRHCGEHFEDPSRSNPDNDLERAYYLLGVTLGAPLEEVRLTYRRLLRQNHPDRFSPDQREQASKRTAEINEAYKIIWENGPLRTNSEERATTSATGTTPKPPPHAGPATGGKPGRDQGWPRWGIWLVLGLITSALVIPFVWLRFSPDPQPPTRATAPAATTTTAPSATTPKASAVTTKTHTFQAGDTLYDLARTYLGDGERWPEIAELNGIPDPTNIPNGKTILIPDGSQRVVATTQAPSTTRVATATSSSCSLDDEVRDLLREWNRVSGELVASYLDVSVGPNQYVADSERIVPTLNRVVRDMRDLRECLPADERAAFEPFLGTYNDKLSGYVALQNAVRFGSLEMEETAVEMLVAANAKSVGMVCEIARITGERLPGVEVC